MLAENLKREIDTYYMRLRQNSSLFRGASQGTLTPEAVHYYLENILHLLNHTEQHMTLAMKRSGELGLHSLKAFYSQKCSEEVGHEEWAKADIENIKKTFSIKTKPPISKDVTQLIRTIEDNIESHPELYLPYIFLAEYYTVIATHELISLLESRCGINRSMLTVFDKHLTLDKAHVEDDLRALNTLMGPSENTGDRHLKALKSYITLYESFCNSIGMLEPSA